MKTNSFRLLASAAALILLATGRAHSAELLVNGGFELGLTGWQTAFNPNGLNTRHVTASSSTRTPENYSLPGPQSGSFYALFDPTGSSAEALYQDFTAPVGGPGALTLSMFIRNQGGIGYLNTAPNFSIASGDHNQLVRIDVMNPGSSIFSTPARGHLRELLSVAARRSAAHGLHDLQFQHGAGLRSASGRDASPPFRPSGHGVLHAVGNRQRVRDRNGHRRS